MKKQLTLATRVTVLACTVGSPFSSRADYNSDIQACQNQFNTSNDLCTSAQTTRDNAAWAALNSTWDAVTLEYNQKLQANATTAAGEKAACDTELKKALGDPATGNIGDCKRDKNSGVTGANSWFDATKEDCLASFDDQASQDACICVATSTKNFRIAQAGALYDNCTSLAQDSHDNVCNSAATDKQNKADRLALSVQQLKGGTANATYYKAVVASGWTELGCYENAVFAELQCTMRADYVANPQNGCVDGCYIIYGQRVLNAQVAYNASVAPASAQEVYDLIMCMTQKSVDDVTSYANLSFTMDEATAEYSFDQLASQSEGNYNGAMNFAEYNQDVANCSCNNPTGDITGCVATAASDKAAKDAKTLEDYLKEVNGPDQTPVGSNWTKWNHVYAPANQQLNADYAAHAQAETDCEKAKRAAYQTILDAANTKWNADMAAADHFLNDICLPGCNQG